MAILRYIPKKVKVIDRRTPEGGFYDAECEECGTLFYPKRSTAKYCSSVCANRAHRRRIKEMPLNRVANDKKAKRNNVIDTDRPVIGVDALVLLLNELGANTKRDKSYIRSKLKATAIGDTFNYFDKDGNSFIISKLSELKYSAKAD